MSRKIFQNNEKLSTKHLTIEQMCGIIPIESNERGGETVDKWIEMSYYKYDSYKNLFDRLSIEEQDVFYIDDEVTEDWANLELR